MTVWGTVPEWVQALSGIAGLIGLTVYCLETIKIRKGTAAQADASRRPFPMLDGKTDLQKMLALVNNGEGIALNVQWRFVSESDDEYRSLGSLTIGESRSLSIVGLKTSFRHLVNEKGIRVIYTDTASTKYWTQIAAVNDYDAEAEYVVRTDTDYAGAGS